VPELPGENLSSRDDAPNSRKLARIFQTSPGAASFLRANKLSPQRRWKEIHQHGDEFYDWDSHAFHYFGGIPLKNYQSLALYEGKEQEE